MFVLKARHSYLLNRWKYKTISLTKKALPINTAERTKFTMGKYYQIHMHESQHESDYKLWTKLHTNLQNKVEAQ